MPLRNVLTMLHNCRIQHRISMPAYIYTHIYVHNQNHSKPCYLKQSATWGWNWNPSWNPSQNDSI